MSSLIDCGSNPVASDRWKQHAMAVFFPGCSARREEALPHWMLERSEKPLYWMGRGL
ncbi:hypothetical protein TNIN_338561, partial [Trichonephila inaurata madagascariensis]